MKAARRSAELVARSLMQAGARHGIVLTSGPNESKYVTRDDVLSAFERLKFKIREDGATAPRLLVYVLMHGVADDANDYLYMLPDDLVIEGNENIKQDYAFRLAKRSVWNIDILSALMNFRLDERLNHFDDFVYSSLLSDKLGFAGVIEQGWNTYRFGVELDRKKRGYGTTPFNNAPIPFVLLIDNCTGGFDYNLVEPNAYLDGFVDQVYDATLDAGRAFYAVKPGYTATTQELPIELASEADMVKSIRGDPVTPYVGPLAIHLKNVLASKDAGRPMSLLEFADRFASSGTQNSDTALPEPPFSVDATLREDVATVEFLPAADRTDGTHQVVAPTGLSTISCCSQPR
ncbi:MAG: hypothetical protein ACR2RE_18710 [Geminicoccaceae bacterium]